MGVCGQRHPPAALPPGKKTGSIVQEAGWAPGPVWTCAEYLAPSGIRSPDPPARSESLYRVCYPGPCSFWQRCKIEYETRWQIMMPKPGPTVADHEGQAIDNKPLLSALYRKRGTETCGLPCPICVSVLWTAPAILYSWGFPPLDRPIPIQMSVRCSKTDLLAGVSCGWINCVGWAGINLEPYTEETEGLKNRVIDDFIYLFIYLFMVYLTKMLVAQAIVEW
jgi:hypothetical protein